MTASRVLTIAGWICALVGVVGLIASPFLPAPILEALKSAVPAGVLVALSGHLLTQGKTTREAAEKESLFYLESTEAAFEEARALLQDGNNDRATWIAAGRALMHADALKSHITVDSHLRVLELRELKNRGYFHDLLSDKTPSFFYGVDAELPLETRGGRRISSGARELSEKSLYAIWKAAQWPKEYRDPLGQAYFSEEDRATLMVLFSGLDAYLEHKSHWNTVSGNLFRRERKA
jgi:hypothetical protein